MKKQQKNNNNNKKSKPKPKSKRAPNGSQDTLDRVPRGNKQGTGFGNKTSISISEDEYITEITVGNAPFFNFAQFLPINPGQVVTFPWLSTIAANYEKFRFTELEFYIKPEVTQYTAGTDSGKVIVSIDPDASNQLPSSKRIMEDMELHVDAMPYETLRMRVPKNLLDNTLAIYVRPGALPGGADIKTYDLGTIFVATQGQTANNMIGELRVRYKCTLSVPILATTLFPPINWSAVQQFSKIGLSSNSMVPVLWNNISPTITVANGLSAVIGSNGTISLQPGNYMVYFVSQFINTASNLGVAQVQVLQNSTVLAPNALMNDGGNYIFSSYQLTGSFFVSIYSGDTISLNILADFSSGVTTCYTSITILAA
jgi:hypothetical protein